MLSIGKMGAGQEGYYLGKVAEGAEDYYSGEGEAEGYWLGDAAEDLGLQGKVDPAQLVGMLTGTNPASGEPLGLRHVEGGPVPGFDLTFSAPKSVSVLWALGGHPVAAEVKAAHAAAVDAALGYLQREACWTRRGAGGRAGGEELAALAARGASLLVYQHFPRVERGGYLADLLGRLSEESGGYRTFAAYTSQVGFLFAVSDEHGTQVRQAVLQRCANSPLLSFAE